MYDMLVEYSEYVESTLLEYSSAKEEYCAIVLQYATSTNTRTKNQLLHPTNQFQSTSSLYLYYGSWA
jgi:hypothetical protein